MDNDPPAIKPWGITNKELLQQLIGKGKVDITKSEYKYIDKVRHCYFRPCGKRNFLLNFKNNTCSRSRELKDEISGARRRERGKVF